jgi:hypothetical protein
MAEMAKEVSKLKVVPVMQVMRMGSTTNGQPLPAASEAPLPTSNGPVMPSAGDVAKQSAASAISNKFGFGGFGKKKKDPAQDKPAEQSQAGHTATPTQSVLMESSTQLTSFSSAPINSSQFSVPAGYAQITLGSNPSVH